MGLREGCPETSPNSPCFQAPRVPYLPPNVCQGHQGRLVSGKGKIEWHGFQGLNRWGPLLAHPKQSSRKSPKRWLGPSGSLWDAALGVSADSKQSTQVD